MTSRLRTCLRLFPSLTASASFNTKLKPYSKTDLDTVKRRLQFDAVATAHAPDEKLTSMALEMTSLTIKDEPLSPITKSSMKDHPVEEPQHRDASITFPAQGMIQLGFIFHFYPILQIVHSRHLVQNRNILRVPCRSHSSTEARAFQIRL